MLSMCTHCHHGKPAPPPKGYIAAAAAAAAAAAVLLQIEGIAMSVDKEQQDQRSTIRRYTYVLTTVRIACILPRDLLATAVIAASFPFWY